MFAARLGERILANTQPFRRVLGGHAHVFAHNGFVPPADAFNPSPWLVPQGIRIPSKYFAASSIAWNLFGAVAVSLI